MPGYTVPWGQHRTPNRHPVLHGHGRQNGFDRSLQRFLESVDLARLELVYDAAQMAKVEGDVIHGLGDHYHGLAQSVSSTPNIFLW